MKIKSLILSALLLGGSCFANEAEHMEHEQEAKHYIALKGMYTFGQDYKNESGDDGYGIAIDFGHRLGHGFAVEIDFSYENTDVTAMEVEEEKIIYIKENAKYYTTSLDLAYVYELTHDIGILAKVGYEYEYEKIGGKSSDDTGFIFAGGVEYAINHTYKFLVEYETSTVDGPKGDMVYAGIMYNF